MKLVKLNRRFKMFREHGHTVALRFDGWSKLVTPIEQVCRQRLGSEYKNFSWTGRFGSADRAGQRPYWISFRSESDATLVLLSVDLTK